MRVNISQFFIITCLIILNACGSTTDKNNDNLNANKPKTKAPVIEKKVCYKKGPSIGPKFYTEVVQTLKNEIFNPPLEFIECTNRAACDSVGGPLLILDAWGAARKNIDQKIFSHCPNSILVVVREANSLSVVPVDKTFLPHSQQKNDIIPVLHIVAAKIYAGKSDLEKELAQW
jgi:hypothetical protein